MPQVPKNASSLISLKKLALRIHIDKTDKKQKWYI